MAHESGSENLASPWTPPSKGLEGVVVASTMISKIDGKQGKLIYRGYDIRELAGNVSFEAVAYLLWVGHLPNSIELDTFRKNLAQHREISDDIKLFLESAPHEANALDVLRTAVSIMGLKPPKRKDSILEDGLKLASQFPTIISYFHHIRNGEEVIKQRKDLTHASNYLYMLTGEIPSKEHEQALDSYFTLLADHGMNASTFSARVTISTLTDIYSAICSAIGTLKGPLHGALPRKCGRCFRKLERRKMLLPG
jgi:citrate synthase